MQKRELNFSDFVPSKIKISDDGLDVDYSEKGSSGDDVGRKGHGAPSPQFTEALNRLQLYMARRLGLLTWFYKLEPEIKGVNDTYEQALKLYNAEIERCKVTGVVFVGSEQLAGVKITGTLKCESGSVGMATPNITFASEKLGYEKEVKEITEILKEEAFLYIFKRKRAQLDLEDEIEAAENPEDQEPGLFKGKNDGN